MDENLLKTKPNAVIKTITTDTDATKCKTSCLEEAECSAAEFKTGECVLLKGLGTFSSTAGADAAYKCFVRKAYPAAKALTATDVAAGSAKTSKCFSKKTPGAAAETPTETASLDNFIKAVKDKIESLDGADAAAAWKKALDAAKDAGLPNVSTDQRYNWHDEYIQIVSDVVEKAFNDKNPDKVKMMADLDKVDLLY